MIKSPHLPEKQMRHILSLKHSLVVISGSSLADKWGNLTVTSLQDHFAKHQSMMEIYVFLCRNLKYVEYYCIFNKI